MLAVVLSTAAQNPSIEELYKLYQSKAYVQVIERALPLLEADENNLDLNLIIGRAHTDNGNYLKAIPHLERTRNNDQQNSWRKAWALGYLGTCYFLTGEHAKAKEALRECYHLNVTKNATQYAHRRIVLFGFDDAYRDWKTVESAHFRFHFQKTPESGIDEFVSSREAAYENIHAFFKSTLPKKIDFFIWDSSDDAMKVLDASPGFADPIFAVVHCHAEQTKGHEMTHVISHYATDIKNKTAFINEGTSVYFDQTSQDRQQMVKNWMKNNHNEVRVKEVWMNWERYPEELSYPLSGLFVSELISKFGREAYIRFFKDQRYEHARSVFGDELDHLIQAFEGKINPK